MLMKPGRPQGRGIDPVRARRLKRPLARRYNAIAQDRDIRPCGRLPIRHTPARPRIERKEIRPVVVLQDAIGG